MAGRVAGKTALVFGAGSVGEGWGNGKASAVLYAREGARVACVDVDARAAAETVRIIEGEGGEAVALQADVTDLARVRTLVDEVHGRFGRIDILHNNVGTNIPGGPVETTEEDWDRVMNVNVKSIFFTCKCVLPIMEAQQAGSIVNISSLASIRWMHFNYISYYASKAAVNNFTRAVALQYADRGIRANTVLPGLMDTPHIYKAMQGHYGDIAEMQAARAAVTPMKRMGTGWDIAHAAMFLASDDARYITGVELCVDGGLHAKTH
jgi:NAD(P)-dependent dehydrogenase (short-subunit alcohol dehydrogenase family)